jgi:cation:H+ antiporter
MNIAPADVLMLLVSFAVILVSCELFTNGIEWLGQKLQIGESVVGSVFAAVGTALPETVLPMIAVLFFKSNHGTDVAIGAIAGAPFMLSTLTLSICGVSVWYFALKGTRKKEITVNRTALCRDLRFFIAAFAVGLSGTLAHDYPAVRWLIAAALLSTYGFYLHHTFKHEGEVGASPESLHLDTFLKAGHQELWLILAQVVIGLAGIISGAFLFVSHVEAIALSAGLSPLILSFVVSPIATEAPEKVNSVLWARSGKDNLALGNVTGALVFQSCIPVAFGLAMTDWTLSIGTIATGIVAISCASLYLFLINAERLRAVHLIFGALAYAITVSTLVSTGLASR